MQDELSGQQEPIAQYGSPATPLLSTPLATFYADRPLMWRNVGWITFGHFGTALSMTIVEPLMNLRLKSIGVSESSVGLLASMNLWAVSFLVMYFSWKSDHCLSRLGRRTPFVLMALPFIVVALILFAISTQKWLLVCLMLMYFFFNDMKASTYPLLALDCASKPVLARVSGIIAIVVSAAGFLSTRIGSRMADGHPKRVFFTAATVMSSMVLIALWRIKEPPIYHPAEGKFNLLKPIRVATQDKRILVLIVACALLNGFSIIFKTWVWFYAQTKLHLTIGDTGVAMSWGLLLQVGVSYPAGWLIDRYGSYVALCLQWTIMLTLALCSVHVTNLHGLILLMMLYFLFLPLQISGDAILWKTMDKADTGSFTSTVSLVRNFCTGTVIAISGFIIRWTHSYIIAFWFGFTLSSIALVVFFIYRRIMRTGPTTAVEQGALESVAEVQPTVGQPAATAAVA